MKKVIIIILLILLIPIVLINIKTLDREEVNPTLTYNLTTSDSTYTDLNNHTLQDVFEGENRLIGVGKNLLPYIEIGSYDGNSGLQVIRDDRIRSPKIQVKPSQPYTITLNGASTDVNVVEYDINGQFIIFKPSYSTITTTSTTRYIAFFTVGTIDNINDLYQLEQGTVATTYESYKSTEKNDSAPFVNWFNQSNFGLESLSSADLDAWYTIYQTYHTTYTTLTLGTATATTYTSLQQLILDNDDKDFKLYRDDIVDESHYRLTQEDGYISITNDDDLEIIRINEDDTFESSLQIDDTIDYKLVGYNVTSYVDGDVANEVLPLIWLIPIVLVGAVFFIIFTGKDE